MTGTRPTVGVLALARPTFDVPYAEETAGRAFATLRGLDATLVGSAELLFDAEQTERALERFAGESLDLLLLLQVSFTDSSMTEAIGRRFDVPIVLWGFPEARTGGRLRLNSFCGINLAAFALTKAGSPFGYLHRGADDPAARADVRRFLDRGVGRAESRRRRPGTTSPEGRERAAAAAAALDGRRIGVIGDHPLGFEPCGYDPAILAGLTGVTVVRRELDELFHEATLAPPAVVAQTRQRAQDALGNLDTLEQEALDRSLRLYSGLKTMIGRGGWSGVATRCWPECFTEHGGAACSPQSMLTDDGTPGTCEADVYGTVTALILQHLAGEPSFVADLVEMDIDGDTGVVWHCGLAPMHMAPDDGSARGTIHSNRAKPLLNEFALRPGPVTIARLSQAGGTQSLVIGSATVVDAPLAFAGTAGVVRFDRPASEVTETIMREGLEHHYGIVYGDHVDALEALAAVWELPVIDL